MPSAIRRDVLAAFREAGEKVTLTPADVGGKPWEAAGAPLAPVDLWARVESYTRRDMASGQVRDGDKRVLVQADVAVPRTGDTLTIRGRVHRVESVSETNLSGVAVLYEVQAREG